MMERPVVICSNCGSQRTHRIYHFPYTKLDWKDPMRGNNGNDRMVIRAARHGEPAGPLSDGSDTLASNLSPRMIR